MHDESAAVTGEMTQKNATQAARGSRAQTHCWNQTPSKREWTCPASLSHLREDRVRRPSKAQAMTTPPDQKFRIHVKKEWKESIITNSTRSKNWVSKQTDSQIHKSRIGQMDCLAPSWYRRHPTPVRYHEHGERAPECLYSMPLSTDFF
jgi:hypothetical protein